MSNTVARVTSPWLTVAESAAYIRTNVREMTRLIKSGTVQSRKRGERGTFIHTAWLDDYMLSLPSAATTPEALRR